MKGRKPQPYRKPKGSSPGPRVQVVLSGGTWAAVRCHMVQHNLSQSGAVHDLVRRGLGLPSFLPTPPPNATN